MSDKYIVKHGVIFKERFIDANVFNVIGYDRHYSVLTKQKNIKHFAWGFLIVVGLLINLALILLAVEMTESVPQKFMSGLVVGVVFLGSFSLVCHSKWLESKFYLSFAEYTDAKLEGFEKYTRAFLTKHYEGQSVVVDDFSLRLGDQNKRWAVIYLDAHYSVDGEGMSIEMALAVTTPEWELKVRSFEITKDEVAKDGITNTPASI